MQPQLRPTSWLRRLAGALVLGRPSDAGESAIRAGVSAFRPAQSLFNSQEGFASSWRFDGWSGIARRARDAFAIAWTASAHEGVDPDSGMGPLAVSGLHSNLDV